MQAALATVAFGLFLWGLMRVHGAFTRRVQNATGRLLTKSRVGDEEFVRSSRIMELLRRLVTLLSAALSIFLAYSWLTFSLQRFPYTRPWLFAVAIAYPYLPGSNSEAFKGMSVFVGLVVSLGSSGIVDQMMSGFTLTYSRALRVGDFVAVGDIEGTVTHLGTLSTKIKTARQEDVTIPNAVVVSQVVTNYSRYAESDGVFIPTDITIG